MDRDVVVHEMRNELTIARANLEAILDGKLTPSRTRLMSVIQALAQLETLIDDLQRTREPVGSDAHPEIIDVCRLLKAEYAALEGLAQTKGLSVTVHRCPLPVPQCTHFFGDPVRIGQIVKNLLLNAVRYTPPGGSIAIHCGRRANQLEVRIADSGPGISEDERRAVFRPGFRGSAGRTHEGSGYGLAVVKRLVEEHGGSVRIRATSTRGTVFVVRLPGRAPGDHAACAGCPQR